MPSGGQGAGAPEPAGGASGEEGSRRSLLTLRHVGNRARRDEGSETVGMGDRVEGERFSRDDGIQAARRAGAALVNRIVGDLGRGMHRLCAGVVRGRGGRVVSMRVVRAMVDSTRGRMGGGRGVNHMASAACCRGRRRNALHGQGKGQEPRQHESNDTPHEKSLSDPATA